MDCKARIQNKDGFLKIKIYFEYAYGIIGALKFEENDEILIFDQIEFRKKSDHENFSLIRFEF